MTSPPQVLLAKSYPVGQQPPPAATLRGHTMMVLAAAEALLASRGAASLHAVGLRLDELPCLQRIVRAAAFLHDLGKCSAHFQAMLTNARSAPQGIRHEAASLWLAWPGQPLAAWLRTLVDSDDELRAAAVAGAAHHRKFWAKAIQTEGGGVEVDLFTDHPHFTELLAAGARRFGVTAPAPLARTRVRLIGRGALPLTFETWQLAWDELARCDDRVATLTRLAKVLVIAADVAGSALAGTEESLPWIGEQLAVRANRDEMEGIARGRLKGHAPRPFQLEVAASQSPVTFVRAGCGSGKTVAAYQWAAQHAGRQLWVTYPTTGTTTEGFRDYVSEDKDLRALLEHSRRHVDIGLLGLHREDEHQRGFDRLEAIRGWGAKVVVATVDTVLGLVQHQRKGMYAWPGLADAALVFDEIHSYDEALFGALLRFLEALPGLPTLLMTASLPAGRLRDLERVVLRVHGQRLAQIDGPADLERLPRYVRAAGDPVVLARDCLRDGGKVLWVSNTVDRCIAVADKLPGATVYHSRFRYEDRVRRHQDVVDAFAGAGAALATATQVAEMSLDLSADLLVTDEAPIAALVQRLGRLNRRATPDAPGTPRPFVVIPVERPEPYSPTDLEAARVWLDRLGNGPLSQGDLAATWAAAERAVPPPTPHSVAWLDEHFCTAVRELRKATPGITVILDASDAARVRRAPRDAAAVAVPMNAPRGLPWTEWPREGHLPVVPAGLIDYDPLRGARWK